MELEPQPGLAIEDTFSFWKNPVGWLRQKELGNGFWQFFAVAFFFTAGFSVYLFLFNLYLLDFHFNERQIGLIGGAMTLGSLAGTLPSGILARRIGLRPLLFFSLIAPPLLFELRAVWIWEPAQIVMAFLAGALMSSWGVCFIPAVARLTTEKNRPSAFSLLFAVGIGTGALGGLVCGYLPKWLAMAGFNLQATEIKRLILMASCGIVLLGIIPMMKLQLPAPSEAKEEAEIRPVGGHLLQRLKGHSFLLRFLPVMALWATIEAAFTPFSNVYLSRQLHIPLTRIGLIFSAAQVLQLCMGLLAPVVFRLLGLINGIVTIQVAIALALGAMAAAGNGNLAIGFYLTFCAIQWMSFPGLNSLLTNETPDKDLSMASATMMFCNALAGAASTAIAGTLYTRLGYPHVLAGIACIAAVIAILFRVLLGKERSTTRQSQEVAQLVP
ncbi:MFS transporter [Acidicapsa ligni]|uniref:MFS transporter n=1 Tax=Acidicapsa ligni TaxID=542300 RepID=UPI0021DFF0F4|nr:MFS transporter [Acidicapsa ligni]